MLAMLSNCVICCWKVEMRLLLLNILLIALPSLELGYHHKLHRGGSPSVVPVHALFVYSAPTGDSPLLLILQLIDFLTDLLHGPLAHIQLIQHAVLGIDATPKPLLLEFD